MFKFLYLIWFVGIIYYEASALRSVPALASGKQANKIMTIDNLTCKPVVKVLPAHFCLYRK
jgi:hypothetical protein